MYQFSKKTISLSAVAALGTLVCSLSFAQSQAHLLSPDEPTELRIGLGQESATAPARISRLRLADPMVQQKYLNDPDMLRFLRGTYSEACSRGVLVSVAQSVKVTNNKDMDPALKNALASLLASQRIWKMSSFEMETVFSKVYTHASYYCDCAMREVTDLDLINPKKGLEVVKELRESTIKACSRMADEKVANHKPMTTVLQ
jgi:hypothetical protein